MRLVSLVALAVVITAVAPAVASANIVTSGSVTGTGTPYNGSANPWNVSNLTVGNSAVGSMNVNGGYVVNNTGFGGVAQGAAASTSTVTVTGAGSAWNNSSGLDVGTFGTGKLDITSGGSVTSAVSCSIGSQTGGNGIVNVGGGIGSSTWTNSGNLRVGVSSATGTLVITGGGSVSNTDGVVGNTGSGMVTVGGGTGASAWTNSTTLNVGFVNTGKLEIVGGGSVSNTNSVLGSQSGGNGTVNVGGGTGSSTWTNSGSLSLGLNSIAMLTISGGGTVSDTFAEIGINPGSSGTATVGGGTGNSTWSNSSSLSVGSSGTGTLNINTSGLVSATALNGGNATSGVNFDGGTLRITTTDSASNSINLLSGGGTIDVPTAATTFTVSSGMSGVGGLTKTGGATLALTGANGYGGSTAVNGGTLKLSGSGSLASSPTVSLATGTTLDVSGVTGGANYDGTRFSLVNGQTLKGTGTVTGALGVASGATLAPGNSVGTLATGNVSIASGGTLALEVDFAGGSSADLLDIVGSFALNSSILNLTLLNSVGVSTPKTFLVARNDGADAITGTFGSITGLPGGASAVLNYAFSGTDFLGRVGDGNDFAITFTAVPEARGWTMLGAVAIGVIGVRAMRRRAVIEGVKCNTEKDFAATKADAAVAAALFYRMRSL